ncbi:hypothetical protein L1887_32061 [Cichorium endivia]|nr:hypothetical protein L1887_32061 [Cichorium endivia]
MCVRYRELRCFYWLLDRTVSKFTSPRFTSLFRQHLLRSSVKMRWFLLGRSRRKAVSLHCLLIASATFTGIGILFLTLRSLDDPSSFTTHHFTTTITQQEDERPTTKSKGCATVEEMGDDFRAGFLEQSLRVRSIIRRHFDLNGAARIRDLPPLEFCKQGFVIAKASEAGFGNEMYKILTAAALSVILNRSLIIGQTRHIGANILLEITYHIQIPLLP